MNQENQQPEELYMTFQEKDAIFRYKRSQHMNLDEFVKLYFEYKNRPTPEELLEHYTVDFKEGTLTNKKSGKKISYTSKRYKTAVFKRKSYSLHNLIYTMYHKRWPNINMLVDHRDQNPLNNSISNLFEVTFEQNSNNKKRRGNHKYGIYKRKNTNKFRVRRCGEVLGYFKTKEEAIACSLAYDKQLEEQGIKPKS